MTDFNDGKIHGWNGGERPVHPKTWVTYWERSGGYGDGYDLDWQHDNVCTDIIAFRVTKVHRELKTIWVNEYEGGDVPYYTREEAAANAAPGVLRAAVEYQEVAQND